MSLDSATLGSVSIILSALMGLLLLFSWSQTQTTTALLWWGFGFFVAAIGVRVLGPQKPSPQEGVEVVLGNSLILRAEF